MYILESRNILTPQNGLNIYRGRTEEHILLTEIQGGDSMDIGIKPDAPDLLAGVLRTRKNKGIILMGNLGDPYNIYEESYRITRKCLKVIENSDYGVVISTKQNRILRDLDVLSGISRKTKIVVDITLPSLDDEILWKIEGRETISVKERLELIKRLKSEGIDVIVTLFPVITFVNDTEKEITDIVNCLADYDVAGIDLSDLRLAVKKSAREFFYGEFAKRFPEQYKNYINEYKETGELYPRDYKIVLENVSRLCDDKGLMYDSKKIKAYKRQYENKQTGEQLTLEQFLTN